MRGVTIQRTILAALAVLGASFLPPGRVFAQTGRPSQTKASGGPAVRDNARLFSPAAVSEATKLLDEVQSGSLQHWQVVVETVESLGGKEPRDIAATIGRSENIKGLIVIISKGDKKVWVEPSNTAERAFSKSEQTAIRDVIQNRFRKSEFDKGLLDAAAEARRAGLGFGVRDLAGMFKPETVEKANAALDDFHKKTRWNVVIETVETLGGKEPRDVAIANAKALDVHGLYILLAEKEHKLWAEPSNSARGVFTNPRIRAIDDAITSAFKVKDFDKGLLDGVAEIRKTAESNPNAVAQAKTPAAQFGIPETKPAVVPHLPAPGDPPSTAKPAPSTPPAELVPSASTTLPKAPTISPADVPAAQPPAPRPEPVPQVKEGSILPFLLIVGGGTLLFLWFVSRIFRSKSQPGRPDMMTSQGAPYPQQPQPRPGVSPGYGPQRPAPAPGPAPGYGYGQPQAPPPGYGYGAPPQQGGGGFVSGALGGLGGAVLGNILYDKFGRAIPQEGPAHLHEQHYGRVDSQGNVFPPGQAPVPAQPAETFDPNAGVGGDWGGGDTNANDEGAGGDWGNAAPVDQGGGGGDWGSPDTPAPDNGGDWGGTPDPEPQGGDWGGGPEPEPEPDSGGGGDWGGGDAGNTDDNQGGGW